MRALRPLISLLSLAGVVPATAHAEPSFALNRYTASELSEDGFLLHRPLSLGHLRAGGQLHADYALSPLRFERNLADDDPLPLVRHQSTAHAVATLGLLDRLVVFAGMPIHTVLTGETLPGQPRASGFGAGDFYLGARGRFSAPGPGASAGARLLMTTPTGSAADGGPSVTGEDGVSLLAELLGEAPMGPTALIGNAGLRFRPDTRIGPTRFSNELTFGLGLVVHALPGRLDTHLELAGAAALDDVGNEATTPLEAALGVKFHVNPSWTVGASGGAGLLPAFGSPKVRAIIAVGYQMPPPQAPIEVPDEGNEMLDELDAAPSEDGVEEEHTAADDAAPVTVPAADDEGMGDGDGDGVPDLEDRCPLVPGRSGDFGCARTLRYEADTGHFAFVRGIEFDRGGSELRRASEQVLTELAATLHAHPDYRVRVDAHARNDHHPVGAMNLTRARALSVVRALSELGIAAERMQAYGCGGRRPLSTGRGGDRRNERIDVWVLQPLPPAGMPSNMGCEPAE